ncbi:putative secreted serine protease [Zalerion maritima]|uniref:Secreted serine protease n=1 Tax=Zalerion maritima TaxID=339359 RepID=A0AAD5RHG6_9PEZI|nr:putative secreted serine protease [Zalerion maritima]
MLRHNLAAGLFGLLGVLPTSLATTCSGITCGQAFSTPTYVSSSMDYSTTTTSTATVLVSIGPDGNSANCTTTLTDGSGSNSSLSDTPTSDYGSGIAPPATLTATTFVTVTMSNSGSTGGNVGTGSATEIETNIPPSSFSMPVGTSAGTQSPSDGSSSSENSTSSIGTSTGTGTGSSILGTTDTPIDGTATSSGASTGTETSFQSSFEPSFSSSTSNGVTSSSISTGTNSDGDGDGSTQTSSLSESLTTTEDDGISESGQISTQSGESLISTTWSSSGSGTSGEHITTAETEAPTGTESAEPTETETSKEGSSTTASGTTPASTGTGSEPDSETATTTQESGDGPSSSTQSETTTTEAESSTSSSASESITGGESTTMTQTDSETTDAGEPTHTEGPDEPTSATGPGDGDVDTTTTEGSEEPTSTEEPAESTPTIHPDLGKALESLEKSKIKPNLTPIYVAKVEDEQLELPPHEDIPEAPHVIGKLQVRVKHDGITINSVKFDIPDDLTTKEWVEVEHGGHTVKFRLKEYKKITRDTYAGCHDPFCAANAMFQAASFALAGGAGRAFAGFSSKMTDFTTMAGGSLVDGAVDITGDSLEAFTESLSKVGDMASQAADALSGPVDDCLEIAWNQAHEGIELAREGMVMHSAGPQLALLKQAAQFMAGLSNTIRAVLAEAAVDIGKISTLANAIFRNHQAIRPFLPLARRVGVVLGVGTSIGVGINFFARDSHRVSTALDRATALASESVTETETETEAKKKVATVRPFYFRCHKSVGKTVFNYLVNEIDGGSGTASDVNWSTGPWFGASYTTMVEEEVGNRFLYNPPFQMAWAEPTIEEMLESNPNLFKKNSLGIEPVGDDDSEFDDGKTWSLFGGSDDNFQDSSMTLAGDGVVADDDYIVTIPFAQATEWQKFIASDKFPPGTLQYKTKDYKYRKEGGKGSTVVIMDTGFNTQEWAEEFDDRDREITAIYMGDPPPDAWVSPDERNSGWKLAPADTRDRWCLDYPCAKRDVHGHGTALGIISAGSKTGMAPLADLLLIKDLTVVVDGAGDYQRETEYRPIWKMPALDYIVNELQNGKLVGKNPIIVYTKGIEAANRPMKFPTPAAITTGGALEVLGGQELAKFHRVWEMFVETVSKLGATVVFAGGNRGREADPKDNSLEHSIPTTLIGPDYPGLLVGSISSNGRYHTFNSRPSADDSVVHSAFALGSLSDFPRADGSRIRARGSSFSAPAVAGLAAYFQSIPDYDDRLRPGDMSQAGWPRESIGYKMKRLIRAFAYERCDPNVKRVEGNLPSGMTVPRDLRVAYNMARGSQKGSSKVSPRLRTK